MLFSYHTNTYRRSTTNRPVRTKVAQAIAQGQILMTYKTKPRVGRKSVTVGTYRTATGPTQYAVIIGGEETIYRDATEAATVFITYVGYNDAWAALRGRGRGRNLA